MGVFRDDGVVLGKWEVLERTGFPFFNVSIPPFPPGVLHLESVGSGSWMFANFGAEGERQIFVTLRDERSETLVMAAEKRKAEEDRL